MNGDPREWMRPKPRLVWSAPERVWVGPVLGILLAIALTWGVLCLLVWMVSS